MFLNPLILAGLGGAAIPLVIHLLARARFRTVHWGAMMFLEDLDVRRQARRTRLRQWTLLGLRMATVALLAVAMARPVVGRRWGVAAGSRTTAVIVLDRSYSMAFEEAGRSRFDKAREAALQVLAGLRPGDQVSLVLLGETVEVLHREPTGNLQAVAREVAELQPSAGAAEIAEGLWAARRILEGPARGDRELYLITDRQASNWDEGRGNPGGDFARWVDDRRSPTRFYVLPVGGRDADNVSVEGIELPAAGTSVVRHQATEVLVRLRNHGPSPRANLEVRLWALGPVDHGRRVGEYGTRVATASATVGPRSATTVAMSMTLGQVGPHLLTAEVRARGLEADNRAHLAIDVMDPIETLIVSGDEGELPARGGSGGASGSGATDEARRESYFLRLALAPLASVGRKGDPAAVTVKPCEELSSVNLNRFQVIVLANVPRLTADQARALEQRVYEGAGLIVAPGPLASVAHYDEALWREGTGLLPARLSAPTPADGSRATSLLGMDLTHPLFRFRRAGDPLPSAVVGRYFPAKLRRADARVLAELATGDPFLVEGPRGRGRVLLLTHPLDADWGTLPLSPFYLPFVQALVRHAAGPSGAAGRNLLPGERIALTFDEAVEEVQVNEKPAREGLLAGGLRFRDDRTQRPGVYRVAWRARAERGRFRVTYYVVRPPLRESDLNPLPDARWEELAEAMGFEVVDPALATGSAASTSAGAGASRSSASAASARPLSRYLASARSGRELWLVLLGCVLALALGELALTRLWGSSGGEA